MGHVSIKEAAQRLGVSDLTIRRRLNSGELQGIQEPKGKSHIWWVLLPEDELADDSLSKDHSGEVEVSSQKSSEGNQLLREMVELLKEELGVRDGQVESWRREVEAQREQLEAKDKQIGELHVLLQQAQAALPEPRENHHSWWRFWQR